jgi:hypothetical protein
METFSLKLFTIALLGAAVLAIAHLLLWNIPFRLSRAGAHTFGLAVICIAFTANGIWHGYWVPVIHLWVISLLCGATVRALHYWRERTGQMQDITEADAYFDGVIAADIIQPLEQRHAHQRRDHPTSQN